MDNQIYGLNHWADLAHEPQGMKTKSTRSARREPHQPHSGGDRRGATYVARGFSGKQKHLWT